MNRNGFSNRVGERLLQERVDETAVRHSAADQHIVEGRDGEVVGGEEGGQRLCELIELLPHDVLQTGRTDAETQLAVVDAMTLLLLRQLQNGLVLIQTTDHVQIQLVPEHLVVVDDGTQLFRLRREIKGEVRFDSRSWRPFRERATFHTRREWYLSHPFGNGCFRSERLGDAPHPSQNPSPGTSFSHRRRRIRRTDTLRWRRR